MSSYQQLIFVTLT